jgi:hypothetical protein
MHRRHKTRQKGQILVEFILIAPVLLAIAGGALEIARFLRFNQVASVFSQEAAMMAYRQCSDFFVFTSAGTFDKAETEKAINGCLTNLHNTIQNRLNDAYPSTVSSNPRFSVVLSVYRLDQTSGSGVGFSELTRLAYPNSSLEISSLYNVSGASIRRDGEGHDVLSDSEIREMERVVIAEVAYMYVPAIPIYKLLMGDVDLMKTNERFRETTIL